MAYDGRQSKPRTRRKRRPRKNSVSSGGSDELTGIPLGTRPLVKEFSPEQNTAPSSPLCPLYFSLPTHQALDTPMSPQTDPSYLPCDTPRSRREMQSTRDGPPQLSRARARSNAQDPENAQVSMLQFTG